MAKVLEMGGYDKYAPVKVQVMDNGTPYLSEPFLLFSVSMKENMIPTVQDVSWILDSVEKKGLRKWNIYSSSLYITYSSMGPAFNTYSRIYKDIIL